MKRHAGARTVLGSGDLFTAQDCLDMLRRDRRGRRYAWPAGRSAIRGSSSRSARLAAGAAAAAAELCAEQREVIAEHYRLAEEIYGPKPLLPVMRKFGIKYARLHPQVAAGPRRLRGRRQLGRVLRGAGAVVWRVIAPLSRPTFGRCPERGRG